MIEVYTLDEFYIKNFNSLHCSLRVEGKILARVLWFYKNTIYVTYEQYMTDMFDLDFWS
jgi:hypothetical protein